MLTFRIDEDHEQAEALITYLKALSFVEFTESDDELDHQEEIDDLPEIRNPEDEKKLEKFDIKDIAGELDLGMRCYVNKTTGELVSIPEELDMFDYSEGLWQESLDQVEANIDDYIALSSLESWESFEIMETFVEKVSQPKLRQQLIDALARKKAFPEFQ